MTVGFVFPSSFISKDVGFDKKLDVTRTPSYFARKAKCRRASTLMVSSSSVKPPFLPDKPEQLPYCVYPKSSDVSQHGLQALPTLLPLVNFRSVRPYRSRKHSIVPVANIRGSQMLQMAERMAASFVKREPQFRYIQLPKYPPEGLMSARYIDAFGSDEFGPWTKERLMYWSIRLMILTDPTAPKYYVHLNMDTLRLSLATMNKDGEVIGGILNEPMPMLATYPIHRQNDIFLNAMQWILKDMFKAMIEMQRESIGALSRCYPQFQKAYANGKVAHVFLIARSDELAKEDTFEMVAASAEHLSNNGFEFMFCEASNQWTGAACEALDGVRVYFIPFQGVHSVQKSAVPLEGVITSPNGWVSDKDSGCMAYVIRLK